MAMRAGSGNMRHVLLRQVRIWHWMTGAVTLTMMALFAVTGVTLNHARQIEAQPVIREIKTVLPLELREEIERAEDGGLTAVVPGPVAGWLENELGAPVSRRSGEWSDREVYISIPKPGGDAWLSINRQTGEAIYETTDRGAIAWLNDLHRGRNTGPVWFWLLDIFAIAALIFCLTGLGLLWMHGPRRPSTWALVGAGVALPLLTAVFFIHV